MTNVILNLGGLDRLQRNVPEKVDALLQTLALTCEADIKDSFSTTSPSPAGDPPGIDTGNLKNNIVTQDEPGGYAVYSNADYSAHLEYGTVNMAARPYMLPGFERTVALVAPKELRKVIE